MGIRCRKVLGYGLTDVQHSEDRYTITDGRINVERLGNLLAGDPTVDGYAAFLQANKDRDERGSWGLLDAWTVRDNDHRRRLDECVIWNGEFGLPNVLVVQPLAMHDWDRYDDPIDYVEETWVQGRGITGDFRHVEPIGLHTLYPFEAFMDADTGEKLGDKVYYWVRAVNDNRVQDLSVEERDTLAQHFAGFETHDEALRRVVPVVPTEVRAITEYLGVFTSGDVWRQLRPVLYVYWS
jgi:hypothetical protein